MLNQNPEQIARDQIDQQLIVCGWVIQHKSSINLAAALGVAVREYQTDKGPADYVLFVDKKPVGIIEAKRAEDNLHFVVYEEQTLITPLQNLNTTQPHLYDPNTMVSALIKANQALDKTVELCYCTQPFPSKTKPIKFLLSYMINIQRPIIQKEIVIYE